MDRTSTCRSPGTRPTSSSCRHIPIRALRIGQSLRLMISVLCALFLGLLLRLVLLLMLLAMAAGSTRLLLSRSMYRAAGNRHIISWLPAASNHRHSIHRQPGQRGHLPVVRVCRQAPPLSAAEFLPVGNARSEVRGAPEDQDADDGPAPHILGVEFL